MKKFSTLIMLIFSPIILAEESLESCKSTIKELQAVMSLGNSSIQNIKKPEGIVKYSTYLAQKLEKFENPINDCVNMIVVKDSDKYSRNDRLLVYESGSSLNRTLNFIDLFTVRKILMTDQEADKYKAALGLMVEKLNKRL